MRVANGAEQSEFSSASPELELTFSRCFEMCFESVPGSVLQVKKVFEVYQSKGSFSKAALASIVVSALTTGFSAATISFE